MDDSFGCKDEIISGLYIVATPIGNLSDITIRALHVLTQVDVIACEDTRNTKKLLDRFGIKNKTVSLHEHNEGRASGSLIRLILDGKSVAYVSDAGTPVVSDPGNLLVKLAHKEGIKIIPVSGASAITASASVSGLIDKGFLFHGFLSHKAQEIKNTLLECKKQDVAHIFFESPRRFLKTMKIFLEVFGAELQICIAREISKINEDIKTMSLEDVYNYYSLKDSIKGEFVIIVPSVFVEENINEEQLEEILNLALNKSSAKDISRVVSSFSGYPKNFLYKKVLCMQKDIQEK
jgi:16S rRNA (cytidine1402-2'-O)-methyltransferase